MLGVILSASLVDSSFPHDGGRSEMTVVLKRDGGVQMTLRLSEERIGQVGQQITGIPADGLLEDSINQIIQELAVEQDGNRLAAENVRILGRDARNHQIVKLSYPTSAMPGKLTIFLPGPEIIPSSLRHHGHEGYEVRMQSEGDRQIQSLVLTSTTPISTAPDWLSIPVPDTREYPEGPVEPGSPVIAGPSVTQSRHALKASLDPAAATKATGESWGWLPTILLLAMVIAIIAGWTALRQRRKSA